MRRIVYPTIMAMLAAAASTLVRPALSVKAFSPQPDPPAFGMIGIDPYETARLNVACSTGPLPGGVAPGPCTATLAFLDTNGNTLAQSTQTLLPGQGVSIDLNGARVAAAGHRTEVRPMVSAIGTGFVLATTEVFLTSNGYTTAVLNPTEPKSLSPTPQ
jgi:hypothetical protein